MPKSRGRTDDEPCEKDGFGGMASSHSIRKVILRGQDKDFGYDKKSHPPTREVMPYGRTKQNENAVCGRFKARGVLPNAGSL